MGPLLVVHCENNVYQCQDLVMQTTAKYQVKRLCPFRPDDRSIEAQANTNRNLHEIE
jgi:hypothetical protein